MSNALAMFDNRAGLPAHVASFMNEEGNIADKPTVPSLSYEGKVWTVSLNGEKTKLMKRDSDGDEVPLSTFRCVVLDYAKRRGRAFYEGAYDPAKPGVPVCWSEDGEKPHPQVKEPCALSCAECPNSKKGSKVTEQGKAIAACSQHRMLVVVPASNLGFQPLRMKIAITSDWDQQNSDLQAQNWFAFQNYIDFLRAKGVTHTAAIFTKIKFDPNVAYPKLIFQPDGWLGEADLNTIRPVAKSDEVKELLAGKWTPAGVDGQPIEDAEDAEVVAAPTPATTTQKAGASARTTTAVSSAPTAAASPQTSPSSKKVVDDDDDGAIIIPTSKPKADVTAVTTKPKANGKASQPVAESVTVASAVPQELDDLLAEWGED